MKSPTRPNLLTTEEQTRLRASLNDAAAGAHPSPFARTRVEARLHATTSRSRVRRLSAVSAAALVAAGTVGGVIVLDRSDAGRTQVDTGRTGPAVASSPDDSTSVAQPAPAPSAPSDWVLDGDGVEVLSTSDDPVTASDNGIHLQVFASDSYARLYVITARPGVHYGLGEDAPGAQRAGTRNPPGILRTTQPTYAYGWQEADGTTVSLRSRGLTSEELVDVGERARRQPGGAGWEIEGDLPAGLVPTIAGPVTQQAGSYVERRYSVDGRDVTLRHYPGNELAFEDRLLDRIDSAETVRRAEPVDAGGGRSILPTAATYFGRTTLLWWDGVRVVELVIESDLAIDDVSSIAARVRGTR